MKQFFLIPTHPIPHPFEPPPLPSSLAYTDDTIPTPMPPTLPQNQPQNPNPNPSGRPEPEVWSSRTPPENTILAYVDLQALGPSLLGDRTSAEPLPTSPELVLRRFSHPNRPLIHLQDYEINLALPDHTSSLPVKSSTHHPLSRYVSYCNLSFFSSCLHQYHC